MSRHCRLGTPVSPPLMFAVAWKALLGALVGVVALPVCCQAQSRSYQALREMDALGMVSAWQTQLSTLGAIDGRAHLNLHVSPTLVRKIYEVVEDGRRTSFAGPTAAHDADIRLRTLLMSERQATLEVREVPLVTLYVQTGSGKLEAIDGETGERRWSVGIGGPDAPQFTPMGNDEHVVAVSGASLYVISPATGKLIFERSLVGMAEVGPTVVGDKAFLGTMGGEFHVYSLHEDSRHFTPKSMISFGRVTDQPRLLPHGIVWTTDRNTVFVGDAETGSSRFKIAASGRLLGAPALGGSDQLFVAMADGFVLAADAEKGHVIWEFASGEPLASPAYVAGDTVYVSSVDRNLFAIDTKDGKQRWVTPGVTQIVAHRNGTLYGETANRKLIVLDAATGSVRGRVTLAAGETVIENRLTDRIYLLGDAGRLRCLRSSDAHWPTVHVELAKPDETERSSEPPSERPREPVGPSVDEAPAEDEDPFGSSDEEEDPFATGDEEEDPFSTSDETEDEDPFGP